MKTTHQKKAIIIGGGLAGLAAASALGEQGWSVDLHESRTRLGGRASSFQDKITNEMIDNCQHVTMGCCTNFQHFCKTTGIDQFFRDEPYLYFIGPDNTVNQFGSSLLPAPFHLSSSFRKLSYFSLREKIQIAKALKKLVGWKDDQTERLSFSDWLKQQYQSEHVIEHFWKVVLTSALSESLDRIALPYARKVFRDGFVANKEGWCMSVPVVPLDQLYGDVLNDWFNNHQVNIHMNSAIQNLEIHENKVTHAITSKGKKLEADEFIIAVPQTRIRSLFNEEYLNLLQIPEAEKLESASISSIHLWLDQPLMKLPHAVITGRMIQWIFNRGMLQSDQEDQTKPKTFYYQIVISASNELLKKTYKEIIEIAINELADIWPEMKQIEIIHSRMVSEHHAVISVTPESEKYRLKQKTEIKNLNFAGDWTVTGWPSTMEGAVRSGYLAVENILNHPNHHEARYVPVVKPDLPASWLSQIVFGL